jgi:uncharacterized membrane protein
MLSIIGLVILIVGLLKKNETITKTSFYILLAAGIFTLPVYFTGEGSEEIVENLPGVSESVISQHEHIAQFTLISISITALFALAGIFMHALKSAGKLVRIGVLVLSFISAGAMARTAQLGGAIRHTETRAGGTAFIQQNGETQQQEGQQNKKSEDDD